ncbi:MAG TPA: hypothetical protein VGQ32_00505 [Thermoanaerobaculia bacterium]|jgi:hypothetical protein|nr:hypothetical protein [Thermoanaerobaculia bacterium]
MKSRSSILAAALLLAAAAAAGAVEPKTWSLETLDGIKLVNVKGGPATQRGRKALRLIDEPAETPAQRIAGGNPLAILTDSEFENGTVEVEIAGAPRAGAREGARGFIGIAFRVQEDPSRFECFYLRPTNGRAEDQLRRNHSTQYISEPEFPWERLRKEAPGVYESYVDLEPGAWTKIRIVVEGAEARLFVHDAAQPALIVHDLKHGKTKGRIALWIGLDTEGYFSRLTVK